MWLVDVGSLENKTGKQRQKIRKKKKRKKRKRRRRRGGREKQHKGCSFTKDFLKRMLSLYRIVGKSLVGFSRRSNTKYIYCTYT